MTEKVCTFGQDGRLVGIATLPDPGVQLRAAPAVLVLNAGLFHRVGPHRLHVDLARELASSGFTVLRFDLSGIGDSQPPRDGGMYEKRATRDVTAAIDFTSKKWGLDTAVLIGMCSGADNLHDVAIGDARVSGGILLDAYGYRTVGFYVRHVARRAFSLRRWRRFLRRKYREFIVERSAERRPEIFERKFPPREKIEEELIRLAERGTKMLFVYTGGVEQYYNYRDQFGRMFKNLKMKDNFAVEYFERSDHTYTSLENRKKLVAKIADWLRTNYGS